MPRRHTSSAAGVLAAVLFAFAALPVAAQDVPGLRGSLSGTQDDSVQGASDANSDNAPGSREGPGSLRGFQLRGGIVEDPSAQGGLSQNGVGQDGLGQDGAVNDLATEPSPSQPLGGLGDGGDPGAGGASSPRANRTAVIASELRQSTVDPGLRGRVLEEEALPAFGIDQERAEETDPLDPFGQPLLTPLRDDILRVNPAAGIFGLGAGDLDPFEPLGTRLGNFLLFTEAEIGGIFTDNVLGTPDGISDYAFEFAPEVYLISDWARHAFEAEFVADRSWYNRFSVEDDKTYAALLRGRLDVGPRTELQLQLGKAQTQDGRNATDITNIAGFQTNVQEEQISAAARHRFNRLSAELEGSISTFDYEELTGTQLAIADALAPDAFLAQDIRDYRDNELSLRLEYDFNPGLSVFFEGELSENVYRQPVTITGITRDSTGYATLAGMSFALSEAFFGNLSLGWGQQSSIAEGTDPVEGVLFNADIVWRPTPMTLVEFNTTSSIATASLVDSLGA
ncbi:MAG: outer membrane beta-barrel protein, partial [Pseudomonadota bacterium]